MVHYVVSSEEKQDGSLLSSNLDTPYVDSVKDVIGEGVRNVQVKISGDRVDLTGPVRQTSDR